MFPLISIHHSSMLPDNKTCLDCLNVRNAASLHVCYVNNTNSVYLMYYVRSIFFQCVLK